MFLNLNIGNSPMLTIYELSKSRSLSIPLIRKCLNRYKDFFKPYIKRGGNNSLLFTDNGVVIFDKISQLKQEGLNLSEIIKYLESEQKKAKEQANAKGSANHDQTVANHDQTVVFWMERLLQEKEVRRKEVDEYNKRILELEKFTSDLQTSLKLLPMGMTPKQIREEWEKNQTNEKVWLEKENKRLQLLSEYKKTSFYNF